MTHADLHRDSSATDGSGSAPMAGPPMPPQADAQTPTGANGKLAAPVQGAAPVPGSVVPPPPPAAPNPSAAAAPPPAAQPAAAPQPLPVPPPPPPRATLPPVRPVAETKVASGVGAARGVRWRGELQDVTQPPKKSASVDADIADASGQENEERNKDQVTREAPPWLVSMVIHLIMLLVLAFISTPAGSSLGSVMLSIGQSERETPAELTEFEIATDDVLNDAEMLEDTEAEVDLTDIFDSAELTVMEEVVPVEMGAGLELAQVRPMFNGRTGAMKKALLAQYGGTAETQAAVERGLQWLKRNQKKKGNWSMRGPYDNGGFSENEAAATSMALLAFLGDGHTHKSGEYADVVERGIKFLVGLQDRKGFFAANARSHERMYAQAQATIAVCELYGMTRDSWLRPYAQRAIDFAVSAQSDQGGWRYEPNFDSDTSVTGWYVMALESGRSAGLDVDISALTKVNDYLDTASSFDDAAYGYQARSTPSPAMTAEGLLCRQYISWKRDHPPLIRGISALLADAPFDLGDRDVYYWYYATQVLHHFGGSPWRRWNDVMKVELPKAQVRGGREDGSWSPQQDLWGKNSGRLYTTCLSIYCLEVYYRHMPLYAADGNQLD